MAPQAGACSLVRHNGGRGVLLGGVPGVMPATVTVIGGGVSGTHAALIAAGMGARVNLLDINLARLRYSCRSYAQQTLLRLIPHLR